MTEFLLAEKYRPETVEDCILPDRLKKVFQSYVDKQEIPNLLLSGPPGSGKTTVARAMCKQLGINHLFIPSSDERGIDTLRVKIKGYASTVSFTGGRKVIILDEADNLTPDAQAALRGTIEEFSSTTTFIFTCNFKSRLIPALHSRCTVIDFFLHKEEKPLMAVQFLHKVGNILKQENIDYEHDAVRKIVEKYFPDYRRTLNELQRFANLGAIDASAVAQIGDIKQIEDLVRSLREKDFTAMRKWVVLNTNIDPTTLYRKIYNSLTRFFKPMSIPGAIVLLAKYQYQAAFVADQELNLVACLTEMMSDCEFVDM